MQYDDICSLSLGDIHRLYRTRALSPVDVVNAFADRIDRLNPSLNAFVTLTLDGARQAARKAEERLAKTPEGLPYLFGFPFSVKDTLPTAGVRTTFGASFFHDHIPDEDAAVVANLKQDGCILLGKTNSSAFGWTAVTENRVSGATPNPWNSRFTAGGSSGGAAVATVTRLCPINIGTDGGGSLRIPASFTGTVGFKGSSGRVPNYPMGAGGPLQHIGAITRNVEDATTLFTEIARPCARDLFSLPMLDANFKDIVKQKLPPVRILYSDCLGYTDPIDPEMAQLCRAAVKTFGKLGCEVVESDLDWPSPEPIWRTYIAAALSNRLKNFSSRLDELEPELREIIEAEMRSPADYLQANLDRNDWAAFPLSLHERFDLLVTPVTTCPPFSTGIFSPSTLNGGSSSIYGWMPFAYPFNLTGQPAISMPAGYTTAGLPVGIQVIGPRFADALVLSAVRAYEEVRQPVALWG